jgi:hypothetical protein
VKRWLIPAGVVAFGIGVIAAGFAYDLIFAGIPYQDAPPGAEARWRFHSGLASAVELAGVVISLLGLIALLVVTVWSLVRRPA